MTDQPIPVTTGSSLRNAFGQTLVDLAPRYDFLVTDCDVQGGTGVAPFAALYPGRFIQCGIMEQLAMGVAAGLNIATNQPVFYTGFSIFSSRALEVARLSVAYGQCNVKIVLSHLGLDVGPDGASCQHLEHYGLWRSIPGMAVIHPCDPYEMRQAVEAALLYQGPVVLFTGRSPVQPVYEGDYQFQIGKASVLRDVKYKNTQTSTADCTLVACGHMVKRALEAAVQLDGYGIRCAVINLSTLKPIDSFILAKYAAETGALVTCEDHSIYTGLFSAVAETLAMSGYPVPIEPVAVMDVFGESGEPEELAEAYGLGVEDIVEAARRVVSRKEAIWRG